MRKNPTVRDQAGRNRARHLRRQRRRGGSRAEFETELHLDRTRPQEHPQNQGQARRQPLLPGSVLESNPGPRQPERIKEGEASPCLQPCPSVTLDSIATLQNDSSDRVQGKSSGHPLS